MRVTQIIKVMGGVIVALLIADAVLVLGISQWRPHIGQADAVIILGAAINTPALYNRTLKGLELHEQDKAEAMVLSGGKIADSDISEAEYMERVIHNRASSKAVYVLEDQSHNTYENILHSKAKVPDADSVIIVSDEFHLARAVLMAKRAGFETVYWDAPEPDYYRNTELRFYYAREFVAMLSYIPKFIFG